MDATSTPSIRVSHHHRYPSPETERRSPPYLSRSPASPMSIPNVSTDAPVPPPLPPPQHPELDDDVGIGHHKGWDWFNKEYVNQHWTDFGKTQSVKPGSSLLGGKKAGPGVEGEDNAHDNEIDPARRGSSISTITAAHQGTESMNETTTVSSDKEEGSSGSKPSSYRLQGERQLEQRSLDNSSQAYDRNLLSRIGGPNTPNRLSISFQSPNGTDNPAASPSTEIREHSRHLSTSSASDRRHPSFDASHRWSNSMPAPGTASPGPYRTAGLDSENVRPATHRHPSFPFDDNVSHRSSYDQVMFMPEGFPMEEGQMKELNINDRSPSVSSDFHLAAKAGIKRRASSPHRESAREERSSVSSAPGGSDLYTRRSIQQLPSRNSSVSKYMPNHGSISSASSYGPRNGSMASSYGLSVASSATSYTSGRVSPGALSPAIDPELGGIFYANSKLPNPVPGPSAGIPAPQPLGQESTLDTVAHTSVEHVHQSRQSGTSSTPTNSVPNGVPNAQGMLMCECCPKKPKKFNTQEDLRAHLMEKQYTCLYCPNRFKNKNEAERHQNSLHLRRHSWSCAALHSVESVFHPSTSNNGLTDVCGFCGTEFTNPADWSKRRDHVCRDHKFGECNQAKKFFRADHFRQHLKHSHGGLSGKWTNMLESVCMREEPPPQTMADRASQMITVGSGPLTVMPPSIAVIDPQGTIPSTSVGGIGADGKSGIMNELPHEN